MAKILVADDDKTTRKIVGQLLKKEGHEILEAQDGEQALALALEGKPQIAVLDQMMPGKNGLLVCRELKTSTELAGIKVLLLSGWTEDKKGESKTAPDIYMAKPFDHTLFVDTIRKLLP